jgi:hypothetical protein
MRYILLPGRLLDTNYRFMSHARPMGFSTRLLDLANLHKIFCDVSSVILWCLVCVVALHTYINCQLLSISYMNPRYVYSCRVMKPKNYTWIQPYPIGVMRNMSESSYDATTKSCSSPCPSLLLVQWALRGKKSTEQKWSLIIPSNTPIGPNKKQIKTNNSDNPKIGPNNTLGFVFNSLLNCMVGPSIICTSLVHIINGVVESSLQ